MSHVLVIAAREIRERKLVFVAAAVIAVLSALAPLIPGTHNYQRGDILIISVAACAVAFAAALAIAFGGAIVGGQLRSGRMSFYFSKPVGAGPIWFGKVIGALTTIAGSAVIILIPALLLGGKAWEMRIDKPMRLLLIIAGSALLLFLVSHVVSTVIASRSPLVLIDLAIALAMTAAVFFIARPLALARATYSATHVVVGVLTALSVAILGAGARQLARGRTDARQNHVELSRVLWLSVFLAVIAAAGYGKWVRTLTPRNISLSNFRTSTGGDWLVLVGQRKYTDFVGSLVMDVRTGKTKQVDARDVVFSRDGRTTAWLRPAGKYSLHVVTGTLDDPTPLRDAGISLAVPAQMVLSDDGSRIAVSAGQTLFVQEIATKRLVGSVQLGPAVQRVRMFFENPENLRVYTTEKVRDLTIVHALRYTPATRTLEPLGRYETDANSVELTTDSAGARVLLRERSGNDDHDGGEAKRKLLDAFTLRPILTSLPGGPSRFLSALFLSDNSMAFVEEAGEGRVLRIVAPSGELLRQVPLVDNGSATLRTELGDGKLLVTIGRGPIEKRRYSTEIIDVASGRVERREDNVYPVLAGYGTETDPRSEPRRTSAELVVIGRTDENTSSDWRPLWRWNPNTGERTALVD